MVLLSKDHHIAMCLGSDSPAWAAASQENRSSNTTLLAKAFMQLCRDGQIEWKPPQARVAGSGRLEGEWLEPHSLTSTPAACPGNLQNLSVHQFPWYLICGGVSEE